MRFALLLGLSASLLIVAPAFGQTPAPATGITVTPSITRLDLDEAPSTFTLHYTNTTSYVVELAFRAEDFTALEEGWKVQFLGEPRETQNPYALASWLTFETQSLILNPGEAREVKVFIDADRLSPGGHYASILAEIKQDSGQGQVGLRGILASLLFVRTATGQEHEEAAIKSFSKQQRYFSFPTKYTVQFQNTGNVELTPYGLIEVKDMFGRIMAKGVLNEESLITLPESIRSYEVVVAPTQQFLLPGTYTAHLSLHYGKANQETQATVRFFSFGTIPLIYVMLTVGSAIVLATVLIVRSRKKIRSF